MAVFTDSVTIYNKVDDSTWNRTVVNGVQWSDKTEKQVSDKVVTVANYATVTFPQGAYSGLILDSNREEDCVVKGAVNDTVSGQRGHRIADILAKYQHSGLIKSVNDNSNRTFLPNIKVVISQ